MSEQFEELPDDEIDDEVMDQVWGALASEPVQESEFPPLADFLQARAEEILTLSPLERERLRPG